MIKGEQKIGRFCLLDPEAGGGEHLSISLKHIQKGKLSKNEICKWGPLLSKIFRFQGCDLLFVWK